MNTNQKIFAGLLGVTLLPVFFVSIYLYSVFEKTYFQTILNHLFSVSEIQKERIESIFRQYEEIAIYLSNDKHLKEMVLKDTLDQADDAYLFNLSRMFPYVRDIFILDTGMEEIYLANHTDSFRAPTIPVESADDNRSIKLLGFEKRSGGFDFEVLIPFNDDLKETGYVAIKFSGFPFLNITESYFGLGDTGENLLAVRRNKGQYLCLSWMKSRENCILGTYPLDNATFPLVRTFNGEKGIIFENNFDDQNNPVYSVGNKIEKWGVDWAILIKMDQKEILDPFYRLKVIVLVSLAGTGFLVTVLYHLLTTQVLIRLRSTGKREKNSRK